MVLSGSRRTSRKHERRLGVLLTLLLSAGLLLVPASAAYAVSGGGCSSYVENDGQSWDQAACLSWNGSQLVADNYFFTETGFAHSHVVSCTIEGTLVSSYGTTHTYYTDCTAAAQANSDYYAWEFYGPYLGAGRQSGDTYSWHACMTIVTGTSYTSCTGSHPISPVLIL